MKKQLDWFVSRDSSLQVWGEYVPVDSWTATARFNDMFFYQVEIYGKKTKSSFGVKPSNWHGTLIYNNMRYSVPTTHSSCKSINDALFYAERDLTNKVLQRATSYFLSRKNITCVVDNDLQPVVSFFGNPRWLDRNLPYGEYFTAKVNHKKEISFGKINFNYWGYSGNGVGAKKFEHWLEVSQ